MEHYLYLRKSRDERHEPDVLRHHRSALLRLAEADQVTIPAAHIFEEVRSGERIAKRPEFARLLGIWERLPRAAGGSVYVMDVDRLSRGTMLERGRIQEALQRASLRVRMPTEIIDLSLRSQRLLFEIKGTVSRHEIEQYKDRVAHTMAAHLREGRLRNGCVPFGYRWSKDEGRVLTTADFPTLQAICRDAFSMSILRLEAKHHVPRGTIRGILRNPTICGYAAVRTEPTEDGEGWRFRAREDWIWPEKPGDWEPAISREEFLRLQEVIDGRQHGRGRKAADSGWARDVLRFAGHEGPALLGLYKARNTCYQTYRLEVPGAPLLYVPRAMIHQAAEGAIRAILADEQRVADVCALYEARRDAAKKRSRSSTGEADCARQLEAKRNQLDRISYQQTETDEPERLASLARVEQQVEREIAQLKEQLRALQMHVDPAPALGEALPYLRAIGGEWESIWAEAPDRVKRLLTRGIISDLIVEVKSRGGRRLCERRIVAVEVHPIWR